MLGLGSSSCGQLMMDRPMKERAVSRARSLSLEGSAGPYPWWAEDGTFEELDGWLSRGILAAA